MTATWTFRAAVLAAAAAVTALTGCGAQGGDAAAPVARSVADPAGSGGPYAGMTATALLHQVRQAMGSLTSVTNVGSSAQGGVTVQSKILHTSAGACALAYEEAGRKTQIIVKDGTLYYKADKAFWAGRHVRSPGYVAGKWVEMPAAENPISAACLFMPFSASDPATSTGTWTLGRRSTYDGTPVTALTQHRSGETTTYLVSEREPWVLRATLSGTLDGQASYTDFDQPANITVPRRSDTIGREVLHAPHGSGAFSV